MPRAQASSVYRITRNAVFDNVDIASILQGPDSDESSVSTSRQVRATPAPLTTVPAAAGGDFVQQQEQQRRSLPPPVHASRPIAPATKPSAKRSMPPQAVDQPAKKQSKWSSDEDALIIELRGRGMKWEDISKHLPGRSAISCRLHYQNYLERRSEWSEERKDKLAQLYERFKSDMWAKVAEELAVPWRAAEAMHWQLGETDMARRAGVVPFSLAAVNAEANAARRNSPSRGAHSHSHSTPKHSIAPNTNTRSPHTLYGGRAQQSMGRSREPSLPPRRDSFSSQLPHAMVEREAPYNHPPMLAPIQAQSHPAGDRSLPSIAELTTSLPTYSPGIVSAPHMGIPIGEPPHSGTPFIPLISVTGYPMSETARTKRRASTDDTLRQSVNRRRIG